MAKREKYMLTRAKYKDIKKYDHHQMECFLEEFYKVAYVDGMEAASAKSVDCNDVVKAIGEAKGVGPKVYQRIVDAIVPLFGGNKNEGKNEVQGNL